jgi:hypothetical protein
MDKNKRNCEQDELQPVEDIQKRSIFNSILNLQSKINRLHNIERFCDGIESKLNRRPIPSSIEMCDRKTSDSPTLDIIELIDAVAKDIDTICNDIDNSLFRISDTIE